MTLPLQLYPAPGGWKLDNPERPSVTGSSIGSIGSMDAVITALDRRVETGLEIALPTRLALFETFVLPSSDPLELADMVGLQLEKRLPYPLEETQWAFSAVSGPYPEGGEGSESRVLAAALHRPRLEALCAPLLSAGHYPERVDLLALRVGEAVGRGLAAAVWWEEDALLFAVYESGVPLIVEPFATVEELAENSARLMLGANVAGGTSAPAVLWLDPALPEADGERLQPLFGAEQRRTLPPLAPSRFPNLAPPQWAAARQRRMRKGQLLQTAKIAGIVAIGIVAAGFGTLAWQKQRIASLDAELDALRPEMETLLVTQTRWNALAPAIDPSRFTVELLHRISEQLPSEKVSITSFTHTLDGFEVQGEASSASEAVAFAEKLRGAEALRHYELQTPPPTLLAGERAQFKITAK